MVGREAGARTAAVLAGDKDEQTAGVVALAAGAWVDAVEYVVVIAVAAAAGIFPLPWIGYKKPKSLRLML